MVFRKFYLSLTPLACGVRAVGVKGDTIAETLKALKKFMKGKGISTTMSQKDIADYKKNMERQKVPITLTSFDI